MAFDFLPIDKKDMDERGWERPDVVLVTGDAYVDHPSFGAAVIARVLEADGCKVAVLAQPDWRSDQDFARFGSPRICFMVTGGNIDSMVAHYTAARRKRSTDAYSPGNKSGLRPDRALTVYCQCIRRVYPDIPVIIGGLEASLRRFAHYDYWDDSVHPSVLLRSGADLMVYGMGEAATLAVCRRLKAGEPVSRITDVRGTCFLAADRGVLAFPAVDIPSAEKVAADRETYAKAFRMISEQQDAVSGKAVCQPHGGRILIQNPPMPPVSTEEFDRVYELPYQRTYHPIYREMGGVPAIEEVRFSIIHNRGCFGNCHFCSLTLHQGRLVASRSRESIVREAKNLIAMPDFKGYIHDVGGPTANFRRPPCEKSARAGFCRQRSCLAPSVCPSCRVDHLDYLDILRALRSLPGVKKVFVRSGIRYDYLMADPNPVFFNELVEHHVSGQLKVAPEHCSDSVLTLMGKPRFASYRKFARRFQEATAKIGKKQYLVPYLLSSHPGATLEDAMQVALYLKEIRHTPRQVQDFYPTPGTLATAMYHTGLDPMTMKPVYVARDPREKAMQRALLQYRLPKNRELVLEAMKRTGHPELLDFRQGQEPSGRGGARPETGRGNRRGKPASKRKTSLTKHLKKRKKGAGRARQP